MSIAYTPIRFGIENQIPNATLTSTPAPVATTPLDYLKDEWRARKVVFDNPTEDIVIEFELDEPNTAEFFALPNSNLGGMAEMRLELFDESGSSLDVLNMEYTALSELMAAGEFRAGIDPWAVPREVDKPEVFVYWFDGPVLYKTGKLTIRHSEYAATGVVDVRLRMLLIGQKLEMEYNFSHNGNAITFVSPPELAQTWGGSRIPKRGQVKTRDFTLSLDEMSESDRVWLKRMELLLEGRPFIVSAYPNADPWQFNDYSMLGRFANSLNFSHDEHVIHSAALRILEV